MTKPKAEERIYNTWQEAMTACLHRCLAEQFSRTGDTGFRWHPVRYLDGARDVRIYDPPLTPRYTWKIERYKK